MIQVLKMMFYFVSGEYEQNNKNKDFVSKTSFLTLIINNYYNIRFSGFLTGETIYQ